MRRLLSILALLAATFAPVAAHASSITYDLTLTNVVGDVPGGTGTLTVDSTPGAFSTYFQNGPTGSDITSLSFTIGGDTFNLTDASGSLVQFIGGNLTDITFAGNLDNTWAIISLATNGLVYQFFDSSTNESSIGTISAAIDSAGTDQTAPVPEPTSLLLFGTGALSLAGIAKRRLFA